MRKKSRIFFENLILIDIFEFEIVHKEYKYKRFKKFFNNYFIPQYHNRLITIENRINWINFQNWEEFYYNNVILDKI